MLSGAGLRVTLKTEGPAIIQLNPLQAAIKKGAVCGPNIPWQRVFIQCKSMVLTGDQNLPGIQVLDRVIGTVMAKFHFYRFGTGSQTQ